MFFFKKKAAKKSKPAVRAKRSLTEAEQDRADILMMIRSMRRKISPEILLSAERAAFTQLGEEPPEPLENDASRLFKMAMKDGGARRLEMLELVERRVNKRLH